MNPDNDRDDIIEGRNAVLEALRAGRSLDKIYLARADSDKSLGRLAAIAREAGVVVVTCDRRKLDTMSATGAHQGVVALAAVREYCAPDDLLAIAAERGEPPLLIVCDEITDPHNLGAILRTAECAGAHGVIIPKRRSAGVTAVVGKASAGAAEHVAVARVANLPSTLKELKDKGLWIFGADMRGSAELWQTDLCVPACLVIGSEGDGMGRLVSECCDYLIQIPLCGHISSLNASAAAAVLLYEVMRQRSGQIK